MEKVAIMTNGDFNFIAGQLHRDSHEKVLAFTKMLGRLSLTRKKVVVIHSGRIAPEGTARILGQSLHCKIARLKHQDSFDSEYQCLATACQINENYDSKKMVIIVVNYDQSVMLSECFGAILNMDISPDPIPAGSAILIDCLQKSWQTIQF